MIKATITMFVNSDDGEEVQQLIEDWIGSTAPDSVESFNIHTEASGRRTKEQYCELFKKLDTTYETDSRSPLHHDRRCPLCVPASRIAK